MVRLDWTIGREGVRLRSTNWSPGFPGKAGRQLTLPSTRRSTIELPAEGCRAGAPVGRRCAAPNLNARRSTVYSTQVGMPRIAIQSNPEVGRQWATRSSRNGFFITIILSRTPIAITAELWGRISRPARAMWRAGPTNWSAERRPAL